MKTYKTEVKLNKEQEQLYKLCISAQRFVWNLYIDENEKAKLSGKYIDDNQFSKWFNNEYLPNHEDIQWLKKAGSKTLRKTMSRCHQSYVNAFNRKGRFPKKKRCNRFDASYYFVRGGLLRPIKVERHRIKVPMFGWVIFKEKGYVPLTEIISGSLKKVAGRYFIFIVTKEELVTFNNNTNEGIGIDLGIKEFMTCSNGMVFSNINKTSKIRKLEKKLKREQRALSRKYEAHKKDKELTYKNFDKNKLRIQKLNYKLECTRNGYIDKCVELIVEQKPNYITIENIIVSNLIKNRHLSKAISDSKFYYTKQKIIQKAQKNKIEVREVDRFYPSSKTCSCCGEVKKDLKLSNRIYKCPKCGLEIDRDFNASLNLKKAKEYKILTTGGLPESNACGVLQQTVLAKSEAEHIETRKSQFTIERLFDQKRKIKYKEILNCKLGSRLSRTS